MKNKNKIKIICLILGLQINTKWEWNLNDIKMEEISVISSEFILKFKETLRNILLSPSIITYGEVEKICAGVKRWNAFTVIQEGNTECNIL